MSLPVTSLYTALILIVAIALVWWVILARRDSKVGVGDGGDDELVRRMRSHGNFIESAPLLLIAMGLMEFNGMATWFLHLFGIVLVASRLSHPIGMTNRYPQYPFRFGSMIATLVLFVSAVLVLLTQFVLG